MTTSKFLNYQELAEKLGIAVPTLYSAVSRGQIPHVRFSGRLVRFDAEEIDRWIAEHRVPVADADREVKSKEATN